MKLTKTPIKDLVVIEPEVHGDDRGFFFESYNVDKFKDIGLNKAFVQDNHSRSIKGVLRGLHFQVYPKALAKLVRCTRGQLWDVAVDLREGSPTYKQWFGIELSEENKKMLYVPEGFAHGFYALTDCDLQYKMTGVFNQEADSSIAWNDPDISIKWPLQGEPILSERDRNAKKLSEVNLKF
ncbi:dTDP-4-dehydrorhamnose 3,5-epimerase [Patescibacteria group bacterium]|nr:dTDP-4-dehydrorhamnose 3,5-epimerase [Patescibacteria group bacterium]MBU4453130.1 dTDP-4-dehydrorhamnose 3,5-epimerase [Patescibacteria group bacterium]MCG2687339.1 dTDP-4-dehydrorhamnose 3,5-epimerase [Candidatus Parcubacteria bacterium]